MGSPTLRAWCLVLVIMIACLRPACAATATQYAVFGNLGVSIGQSSSVNGIVASNGDISVNPFSTFSGLTGAGNLLSSVNGGFTVNGDVTFNGNVTTGSGATITGTINSGGTVDLGFAQSKTASILATGNVLQGQSATTTGTIRAGGSFSNQDFSVVNGNVFANAGATVNGSVVGNVTAGGIITVGPFGSITGSSTTGTNPVNPATYSAVSTPAAIPFASGGAAVVDGGAAATPLQPGSYSDLNIPVLGNLFLTSGDYFFNNFSFNGDTIFLQNLTANDRIRIFVAGTLFEGAITRMTIDGQPFATADASLSSNVLWETLGAYSQDPLGDVQTFGTIFAPNGDITIGQFSSVTGSVIGGGQVNISVGFNESFVTSSLVPEPASLAVLSIGVLALLRRTGRRHRL